MDPKETKGLMNLPSSKEVIWICLGKCLLWNGKREVVKSISIEVHEIPPTKLAKTTKWWQVSVNETVGKRWNDHVYWTSWWLINYMSKTDHLTHQPGSNGFSEWLFWTYRFTFFLWPAKVMKPFKYQSIGTPNRTIRFFSDPMALQITWTVPGGRSTS